MKPNEPVSIYSFLIARVVVYTAVNSSVDSDVVESITSKIYQNVRVAVYNEVDDAEVFNIINQYETQRSNPDGNISSSS